MTTYTFQYDEAITAKFPDVVGGVIIAEVTNSPLLAPLQFEYTAEQNTIIDRLGDTPLSEIPSLAAWREVFRGFGVDPTKYRSAAEALLRRLTKKGDIPSINTLVDLGNLVSIRYALPVAVFDVRDLSGETLTVKFADGTEPFFPLGATDYEHPEAGEVVFTDAASNVYARRWCWRQSAGSAAQEDTTRVIITVEGHHGGAEDDVKNALHDLNALLKRFAEVENPATGIVDKDTRAFNHDLA